MLYNRWLYRRDLNLNSKFEIVRRYTQLFLMRFSQKKYLKICLIYVFVVPSPKYDGPHELIVLKPTKISGFLTDAF